MFVKNKSIYYTDICFRFEIASYSGRSYQSAKSHCTNIGGEIVSRLLGNDGVNYHRFA